MNQWLVARKAGSTIWEWLVEQLVLPRKVQLATSHYSLPAGVNVASLSSRADSSSFQSL